MKLKSASTKPIANSLPVIQFMGSTYYLFNIFNMSMRASITTNLCTSRTATHVPSGIFTSIDATLMSFKTTYPSVSCSHVHQPCIYGIPLWPTVSPVHPKSDTSTHKTQILLNVVWLQKFLAAAFPFAFSYDSIMSPGPDRFGGRRGQKPWRCEQVDDSEKEHRHTCTVSCGIGDSGVAFWAGGGEVFRGRFSFSGMLSSLCFSVFCCSGEGNSCTLGWVMTCML